MVRSLKTPLTEEDVLSLKAGDCISLSGTVYTARDAAHQRMTKAIATEEPLPFELEGQVIYYVGPCPASEEHVIGACGPTTSGRLDGYTAEFLKRGLKGMIGKGERSSEVREAMQQYPSVYLAAVGGAGAYLSKRVKKAEILAYADLGPEAIMKLEVEDFPCVVAVDAYGGNLYHRV